jgi:hypothetical protein
MSACAHGTPIAMTIPASANGPKDKRNNFCIGSPPSGLSNPAGLSHLAALVKHLKYQAFQNPDRQGGGQRTTDARFPGPSLTVGVLLAAHLCRTAQGNIEGGVLTRNLGRLAFAKFLSRVAGAKPARSCSLDEIRHALSVGYTETFCSHCEALTRA